MPFPLTVEAMRVVTAQCLVCWRGNRYSVPPGMAGRRVVVRHRLGAAAIQIVTAEGLVTLAAHHIEADGAGVIVRAEDHVTALERRVLAEFTDRPACKSKTRRPPSLQALTEAELIRAGRSGGVTNGGGHGVVAGQRVVVDFDAYLAATGSPRAPKVRESAKTSTQEGETTAHPSPPQN